MKKVKPIDLASIDTVAGSNAGFDVQLYNPGTNVDLGITIRVLGKDSDEFQKVSRTQSRKRTAKMTKGGFRNVASMASIEEIEQDGLELLAACTIGWHRIDTDDTGKVSGAVKDTLLIDGNEIPFSVANALMVYERFPWIKEQVDIAIGDRANFIKS